MLRKFEAVMVGLLALTVTANANAQGNGSTPNGKPFVEIQGVVIEVQADLDNLEQGITDRVNELIPQIEALEGKVETLEDAQLVTEQLLLSLQAEQASLQASLDGTDASLQTEIDLLQAKIDANAGMIELMETELVSLGEMLNAKQNVINGLCADGSAIRQVNDDGSVICETTGAGIPTGYTKVQKTVGGWMNATTHETLTCPVDASPVSTGVYAYRQFCWWRPTIVYLWGWFPIPWLVYTCESPNLNISPVYSEVVAPVPGGSARFHG